MPSIENVERAAEVAERFLAKYYAFRRLVKAERVGGEWLVEFDVGILSKEIVRIRLDANTGEIVEYEVPFSESFRDYLRDRKGTP